MRGTHTYGRLTAALLSIGGALLLLSCGDNKQKDDEVVSETLMTQRAEALIIIDSKQGSKKYRFETPLVEGYDYAKEPYKEFRKGVKIETYTDSTNMIESTLVADYAIFFEKRELWEAKGNVVVTNIQGHILETQQLFWNQRTSKIYSNIDSKITQGDDVMIGVGFESDEAFKEWEFRRPRGKATVEVDTEGSESSDGPVGSDAAVANPVKPTVGDAVSVGASQQNGPKPKTNTVANSIKVADRERQTITTGADSSGRDASMLRMDSLRAARKQSIESSNHKGGELTK